MQKFPVADCFSSQLLPRVSQEKGEEFEKTIKNPLAKWAKLGDSRAVSQKSESLGRYI
jgi:hypothetical protein